MSDHRNTLPPFLEPQVTWYLWTWFVQRFVFYFPMIFKGVSKGVSRGSADRGSVFCWSPIFYLIEKKISKSHCQSLSYIKSCPAAGCVATALKKLNILQIANILIEKSLSWPTQTGGLDGRYYAKLLCLPSNVCLTTLMIVAFMNMVV